MNFWDRILLVVWRCTIGPALFCLMLLCGIASFFLGGRRFFLGCWKMAMFSETVDWDSYIQDGRDHDDYYELDELPRTNLISRLLWTLFFGLWLRILFLALMAATHLLFSDWLALAMLGLANCARNPAYVRFFETRNWKMEDDCLFHKEYRVFRPYEIHRRSDFSKLDGGDWEYLLTVRPQFADKCDWAKLDGDNWWRLLAKQPQFADKCDWAKLDGWNWMFLLREQPQFASMRDWAKLDGWDWAHLLANQPQFADKCDWSKLTDEDWASLLEEQPQFADKRSRD